ncbi:NarK family nitrate/nitrite MFS transporter [Marinobacter xestospongiae]|uniref:NarK family nitrate/nitrite MFS transporter n=1 Tax=Marinobacter xestospongiae TaxID=994319 RepID=UPI00200599CC|nr:NarK family nitrate/nitrite MFS transporter [Marinobacter xestospongiae]MCK7565103.1 NarK family nitrate/nitrite MFS transporter [Marinobacter xestospongiae]
MSDPSFRLLSFQGKTRILHLSWMAFFISFLVWFNHAPLMATLREQFSLSDAEVNTLLLLNVALTIPARILIGMLVDTLGPRRVYALVLAVSGVICLGFAMATSFQQLAISRFLLGFVGAGFVVGIRLISEWYPARELGLAEGIYGGWGNFGAAFAGLSLPALALAFGGDAGWRYAIACTGVIAILYAGVFYLLARDTPKGSTYFKPKKGGAMEVTSRGDFVLYGLMNLPLFIALALIVWKLGPANLAMLDATTSYLLYALVTIMMAGQFLRIWQVNGHVFRQPVPAFDRYPFKQVALLNLTYMASFGSELAVVSMLPLYFLDTFDISPVLAGLLGGSFALMNLVGRPGGGYVADRWGRKLTTLVTLAGIAVGYLLMGQITSDWPLVLAVALVLFCSVFVQAGCGAVYASVPLVKRRLTGQVAGMAGAYGNVGGVVFLLVLSLVSPALFFVVLGGFALVILALVGLFMDEPDPQTSEVLPDGTVRMIEVS